MKHRIVVLGAGYAGTGAARRLAGQLRSDEVEIELVNAEPDFVERVRLHQIAVGYDQRPRPLTEIFAGTGVRVRTARVGGIDADRRLVELTDGGTLGYDTLVYALGSTDATHGVPGVAEYAHTIAGRDGALRLRARLNELPAGARIVVVGGGLTGIEFATEIAEARPDLAVTMIARQGVGSWLSEKGRAHIEKVFERLGITVRDGAEVVRVEADGVMTTDAESRVAEKVSGDVVVWTAGFAVHPIAAASTLEVTETGRIVVDNTMRSVSHPEVYAIGDAASAPGPDGITLRMSCAAGTPMAWRAADAISARLTGGKVPESPIGFVTQCISLGRRDALVQRVRPDDSMTSQILTGGLAARVKEMICTGAAWGAAHPNALRPVRRRRLRREAVVSAGVAG